MASVRNHGENERRLVDPSRPDSLRRDPRRATIRPALKIGAFFHGRAELAKQCVAKGLAAADLESQVDFERLAGMTLKQTEDQKEAVKSFMEKREPRYQGK